MLWFGKFLWGVPKTLGSHPLIPMSWHKMRISTLVGKYDKTPKKWWATTSLQSATNPGGYPAKTPFPGRKIHDFRADDSLNCLRFAQDTKPISLLLATRHAAYGWTLVKTANSTPIFGHQEFGKMFAEFVGLTSDLFFSESLKKQKDSVPTYEKPGMFEMFCQCSLRDACLFGE